MNIIDKLKNNERAWKFLSPEEQACMKKANAKIMVEHLRCDGTWKGTQRPWSSLGMVKNEILRIKSDYQLKPEYDDEVFIISKGGTITCSYKASLLYPYEVSRYSTFDHCFARKGNDAMEIAPYHVATYMHEGYEVFARFKNE